MAGKNHNSCFRNTANSSALFFGHHWKQIVYRHAMKGGILIYTHKT